MEHATSVVGTAGEDVAAAYLLRNGYRILGRNVRLGKYELDIVARDIARDMIVFVEVKTRVRHDSRYPLRTAVDKRKRRALRKGVARWVVAHKYEGAGRTDIIGVAGSSVTEHLVNFGSDVWI
jgi:putative endonuclease